MACNDSFDAANQRAEAWLDSAGMVSGCAICEGRLYGDDGRYVTANRGRVLACDSCADDIEADAGVTA